MKKYIYVFLFSLFVVGCFQENKIKTVNKPNFKEFVSVCHDSIYIDQILHIWYWKADGNRAYIFSPRSTDAFIFVYSLPKFEFLYKYGSRGNGPNEYITVNWGDSKIENEFILYDIMKRKLYLYTSSDSMCFVKQSFDLHGEFQSDMLSKPFTMAHKLNDSIFLLKVDSPNESYLEIADLHNKKTVSHLHSHLKRPKQSAYTPFDFVIELYDNIIISAYYYIDRIEISEINEKFDIETKLIIGSELDQSSKNDYNNLDEYYTDIKCDGKLIFAVNQNGKSYENSSIEIFDINGSALGKLQLDQYIELILLSTDSKYIYGYNSLVESNFIYIYEVPEELTFR